MREAIRKAAEYADGQPGHSKPTFYLAISLLSLMALAFVATAVYALVLGGDENRSAVAGGLMGGVVCVALVVGVVTVWSRRADKEIGGSPRRGCADEERPRTMNRPLTGPWFLFLLFAAALAVAFGAWELANGRESFGLGLIAVAVVDVLVVGGLRLYKTRLDRQQ